MTVELSNNALFLLHLLQYSQYTFSSIYLYIIYMVLIKNYNVLFYRVVVISIEI